MVACKRVLEGAPRAARMAAMDAHTDFTLLSRRCCSSPELPLGCLDPAHMLVATTSTVQAADPRCIAPPPLQLILWLTPQQPPAAAAALRPAAVQPAWRQCDSGGDAAAGGARATVATTLRPTMRQRGAGGWARTLCCPRRGLAARRGLRLLRRARRAPRLTSHHLTPLVRGPACAAAQGRVM